MPLDPAQPVEHSDLSSQVMREQINALKELIDAVPTGTRGSNSSDGAPGSQGPPGQQGEVSNAALETAIAGTSANSNAVTTLDTPFADPDAEALRRR